MILAQLDAMIQSFWGMQESFKIVQYQECPALILRDQILLHDIFGRYETPILGGI